MGVAVGLARRLDVVRPAEESAVVDRRRATLSARVDVVDLQPHRGATDAAVGQLPLAFPFIPLHDLSLHPGRDRALPLPLLLDEKLQRRGEHLLVGRAGGAACFAGLRLLEQPHELPGDRDVHPARSCCHRLDEGPRLLPSGHVQFAWANFRDRRRHLLDRNHRPSRFHPGHHRTRRHHRPRLQLRRQLQGLLLGESVEPREHRGQVLLCHHRGQHRRGGEAELPFPDRLQHLGESLDEPGSGAPVMSRRAGELQAPVKVREEVRVSQRAEEPEPVELGERFQEGAQGGELDAEEIDESGVKGSGLVEGVVAHERKCLTRIQGFLERARIPSGASHRREIANLAGRGESARTRPLRSDEGLPATPLSRRATRAQCLSIQRSITPRFPGRPRRGPSAVPRPCQAEGAAPIDDAEGSAGPYFPAGPCFPAATGLPRQPVTSAPGGAVLAHHSAMRGRSRSV